MPQSLHQIIALRTGKVTKTQKALTELYHQCQRAGVFDGMSRTYQPVDSEGETLPPESKKVQFTAQQAIEQVKDILVDFINLTLTQDVGNQQATANIVIDGKVLVTNIPVSTLLFLEKQLVDIATFVDKIPVLDPAQNWTFDSEAGYYKSDSLVNNRTNKIQKPLLLAPATKEHPAQTQVITVDEKVGEYSTTKFSGAISATEKEKLTKRVQKVLDAVKLAREEANSFKVEEKKMGEALLNYIFD